MSRVVLMGGIDVTIPNSLLYVLAWSVMGDYLLASEREFRLKGLTSDTCDWVAVYYIYIQSALNRSSM
jgi:hypothetical protein